MTPIISIRGLGKRYRIDKRVTYTNLREQLAAVARSPFRRNARSRDHNATDGDAATHFWALRGVNLDVMQGDVLGIIGRNGAGKSTLLKILSRITEPTEGEIEFRGRLASLLEVGTGFHSELTGRENIYLNGAILGMKRGEIAGKFDEIVDFSEVEKFIDTPVKRYSSGMYVRLAFAVAAYLQPEILLIDEVLAVGDAEFQKKCLGKMNEVARGGRTVLFVSHNMAAVESLCSRCLLIKSGEIASEGAPTKVIADYMVSMMRPYSGRAPLTTHPGRLAGMTRAMESVTLATDGAEPAPAVRVGATLQVKVSFKCGESIRPGLGVVIKNSQGVSLLAFNNSFIGGYRFDERVTRGTIACKIERLPLMPGSYFIDLWLHDDRLDIDMVQEAISFEVEPSDFFGNGRLPPVGYAQIVFPASFSLHRE